MSLAITSRRDKDSRITPTAGEWRLHEDFVADDKREPAPARQQRREQWPKHRRPASPSTAME
jgi:hypothetical protein